MLLALARLMLLLPELGSRLPWRKRRERALRLLAPLHETSRRMMPMPSPAAVWPAMVRLLRTVPAAAGLMYVPTSATTIARGWLTASGKERGPESLTLVTW